MKIVSIHRESEYLLFDLSKVAGALGVRSDLMKEMARLLERRVVRENQSIWSGPSRDAATVLGDNSTPAERASYAKLISEANGGRAPKPGTMVNVPANRA